jgi:glycosyltransferase involved in cell wall biosynthesis
MRLLLIGTDRTVFTPGSTTRRRLTLFGSKYVEALDSIVFSTRKHGIALSQALAPTVHAYPTNSYSRLLYGWNAIKIARRVPRPDIVSAQDPFETGLAALFIARYFRVPLAIEVHTDFLSPAFAEHSLSNWIRVRIADFVIPRATGGYTVSEPAREALLKRYKRTASTDNASFAVLPIFVDISRFSALPRMPKKGNLLWVGRFAKEKNPALAVKALAIARAAGHDVRLTMLGTGPLETSVRMLIKHLRIEEFVTFQGWKDPADYLPETELVLATSEYEGYGMSIVEALSAGVPVLSTDVGIAREAGAIITSAKDFPNALCELLSAAAAVASLQVHSYANEEEYFSSTCAQYESLAGSSQRKKGTLLILTQVVDRNDTSLSFFLSWIEELATHFESIMVICLKEGEHSLPENVKVYSLGKESGPSRIKYIARFYTYIWRFRNDYSSVFVHMNQEYVLLGGWLWSLLRKRVALWRNYHSGNFLTDVAAFFCTTVFCTSTFSYTARYKKTTLMPVGVDTTEFASVAEALPPPRFITGRILSFGRIAPSKRIEVFIEALGMLSSEKIGFTADIYGDPLPEDKPYQQQLQELVATLGLKDQVTFYPGVPSREAASIYSAHEIFVNASPSGMYDKMIFEGAASGDLILASSGDWARISSDKLSFDGSAVDLAKKLRVLLGLPETEKARLREEGKRLAHNQSLSVLGEKLSIALH